MQDKFFFKQISPFIIKLSFLVAEQYLMACQDRFQTAYWKDVLRLLIYNHSVMFITSDLYQKHYEHSHTQYIYKI